MQFLGQMLDDIATLVLLAALHERASAEAIDDGTPQGLAAVDHPQPGTVGVQPTIDEVAQQLAHDPSALGGALAQPQHMLVALGVDAECHQNDTLAEVDAVDHDDRQIQLFQRA